VNEREYRRLLQQVEDEYRRKKDALEIVWKMTQTTSNGHSVGEARMKRGTIEGLVRDVLAHMRGEFSPREVIERINQMPNVPAELDRSSVSSALKRLADDGVLEVTEVGKGKRASRYRLRVANANATQQEPDPPPEPENPFEELEPDPEAADWEPPDDDAPF